MASTIRLPPQRRGLLGDSVEVECDGGTVTVKWDGSGGVVLTGPVQVTLHGTIAEHFFQTCEEH